MQTKHLSPEFEVICQRQANAKFFVASFETRDPQTGGTTDVAATYTDGNAIGDGTVW